MCVHVCVCVCVCVFAIRSLKAAHVNAVSMGERLCQSICVSARAVWCVSVCVCARECMDE